MSHAQIDLRDFFSVQEIELLAREACFVERKSPVSGFKLLMTLSVGALTVPDGTLSQFAAYLSSAFGILASPQAIHERLDSTAAAFMRLCLAKALEMSSSPLPFKRGVVEQFSHIYIADSTSFQLAPALSGSFKGNGGASSEALMRIQLVFDYVSGLLHVEIGDTTLNDASALGRIISSGVLPHDGKCLYLADLGYFKTSTYEALNPLNGQFFLSKHNFRATLKDMDGRPIDLKCVLQDGIDMPATLGSANVRLLARRVPDHVAAERIRKAETAAKRKGNSPVSIEYRRFLHFSVFITTLPACFDMDCLLAIYRIRWLIELIFKSWKSILNMHKIRSARPERVICEVCGKLIVAALSSRLSSLGNALLDGMMPVSGFRLFKHLRAVAHRWSQSIIHGQEAHMNYLPELAREIARLCRKTSRGKSMAIEQRLCHCHLRKELRTSLA